MKTYDAVRQEWTDPEEVQRLAALHAQDTERQRATVGVLCAVLAVCTAGFGIWAFGWKDEPPGAGSERPWSSVPSGIATDPGAGYPGATDPATAPAFTDPAGGSYPGASGDPGGSGASSGSGLSNGTPSAGYVLRSDAQSGRIAVPGDWAAEEHAAQYGASVVTYRSPSGDQGLRLFAIEEDSASDSARKALRPVEEGGGTVTEALRVFTSAAGSGVRFSYEAPKLEMLKYAPGRVSDLRFTDSGGTLRALVGFEDGAGASRVLDTVIDNALAWYCPPNAPGGGCGQS